MPNQLRSNTLPPIVSNSASNSLTNSYNFSSRFHRTTNSRESMLKTEGSRTNSRLKLSPRTPPASYGTCNSSLANEFTSRFFGRNGGKPAVIGLDAKRILKDGYSTSRSLTGFFPPVKLRTTSENSNSKNAEKPVLKLRIKPCRDKPEVISIKYIIISCPIRSTASIKSKGLYKLLKYKEIKNKILIYLLLSNSRQMKGFFNYRIIFQNRCLCHWS